MATDPPAPYILVRESRFLHWPVATYLRAPYAALHSIWSGSGKTHLDLGNYHTAWLIEEQARPARTFLIHDSRDDGTLDQNRSDARYEWHIHGPDEESL